MIGTPLRTHSYYWLQIPAFLFVVCCAQQIVTAETPKPVLVSTPTSTRAIAIDAVAFTPEPFFPTTSNPIYDSDNATRIILFAMNLSLEPGEVASAVTADAEDRWGRHHTLIVEYVGKVSGQEWLTQLTLRLNESMYEPIDYQFFVNLGDVLIRIGYHDVSSNRVRVGIGFVGGGPSDDHGAVPTPAPLYSISGRLISDATAPGGVSITLTGSQTRTITPDGNGNYAMPITATGDFTVTPTSDDYAFTPLSTSFTNLNENQIANFSAALRTYPISGYVLDENGNALGGVTVTLGGPTSRETTTGSDGKYNFADVPARADYTLSASARFFNISPQALTINQLSGPQAVPNFTATRNRYNITGQILDNQGRGLDGVSVTLGSSAGDSASMAATTTTSGTFSLTNVPAGFTYTITPTNTSLFAFTPQSSGPLESNLGVSFTGTLRSYAIGGVIKNRSQQGTGGVSVTLSGPFNLSTVTDADGKYSFADLPAGKTYNVSIAKTDHIFDPSSRTYLLLSDEKADFTAIRQYRIAGRVTDNLGNGLFGIKMKLSGAETRAFTTPADGSYSFIVTTDGNYLLTPTLEQDFYQFSPPSQSFMNLSDHQTVNFAGTISITGPTYVLEFDGSQMSVDYGIFWPHETNVGPFFWEFWAMPGAGNDIRYILSDGYGGAHTVLFGFINSFPGRYSLFGNVWNGSQPVYFVSDEGPASGEWGHFAVGWDGNNIITYYNGVPVGKQPFAGPRVSTGLQNGSTLLMIGGSNHQNFAGRIAQVRGYEENNPRAGSPESTFVPQTIFSVEGQLLSYYFRPAERVADLSNGFNGAQHRGWPRGMAEFYFNYQCPGCPVPTFVLDPTAPDFSNSSNPGQLTTVVASPAPAPNGARIFDSFQRNNSTHILGGKGGLGITEAGTAGTKSWQTNVDPAQQQPFGILAGGAVLLANDTAMAWVQTDALTGNLDIRVNRTLGINGSGANTGLCFRVIDKNNYFFAYTKDDPADPSGPRKLSLGYYLAGIRTTLVTDITIPAVPWRTLRVVTTQSGSINIYADDYIVYSTTSGLNAFATGAGLYNHASGMGLTNRWDNFIVLNAP